MKDWIKDEDGVSQKVRALWSQPDLTKLSQKAGYSTCSPCQSPESFSIGFFRMLEAGRERERVLEVWAPPVCIPKMIYVPRLSNDPMLRGWSIIKVGGLLGRMKPCGAARVGTSGTRRTTSGIP